MKKDLLILGLLFSLNSMTYGHIVSLDTISCPVCGDSVVFFVTRSMMGYVGYKDFQKDVVISYYEDMINSCSNCYYSGYYSDFDTTFTTSFIDSIKAVANNHKDKKLDNVLECEIAADIKMLSKFKYDEIANIYLVASYLLRNDSAQIKRRKELQIKTADFFIQALNNKEYEKDVIATINYLIGEMYRRTGNFNKAVLHYDLAIKDKNKQDWVKNVAIKQKKLAIKKDENNQI